MTKLPTDLSGRDLIKGFKGLGSLRRGSGAVILSLGESLHSPA